MEFDFSVIANYGAMGIMLLWFMYDKQVNTKENTKVIQELTNAVTSLRELIITMKGDK